MTDLVKSLAIKFNRISKKIEREDQFEVDYMDHDEFVALIAHRDIVEQQLQQHMDMLPISDMMKVHCLMWKA